MRRFIMCLLGKHPMLAMLTPNIVFRTSLDDTVKLMYCPFCMRVVVEKVEVDE